jgi:hypothetical protein
MRKPKIVLGIAVLVLIVMTGWQIASWELANVLLQEEIRDMASEAGVRVGFVIPRSDEDLSRAVVLKAKEHGIELEPAQVTVRRTGSGEKSTLYLAADYTVPVNLAFFSFRLHFTPSSGKKAN